MVSERMTRDRLCKGMSSIRAMRTMQEQPWRDGLQRAAAHLGWKRRLHESKRVGLVRLVRLAASEVKGAAPLGLPARTQLEADLGGLLPRRHEKARGKHYSMQRRVVFRLGAGSMVWQERYI